MKTKISDNQACVLAEEILSDYAKRKVQPQSNAHQKTNHFFDSIRDSYHAHRGALGKMTLKEFNKLIIPFCRSLKPPSRKKLAQIDESEDLEKLTKHFFEVNCSVKLPEDEEQEFLEDIMSEEGANLLKKFSRVA